LGLTLFLAEKTDERRQGQEGAGKQNITHKEAITNIWENNIDLWSWAVAKTNEQGPFSENGGS